MGKERGTEAACRRRMPAQRRRRPRAGHETGVAPARDLHAGGRLERLGRHRQPTCRGTLPWPRSRFRPNRTGGLKRARPKVRGRSMNSNTGISLDKT